MKVYNLDYLIQIYETNEINISEISFLEIYLWNEIGNKEIIAVDNSYRYETKQNKTISIQDLVKF